MLIALHLSPRPVTLITTGALGTLSSSEWAQGGIAAAVGPDDSTEQHLADTLAAGAGLCDPVAARRIIEAGPDVGAHRRPLRPRPWGRLATRAGGRAWAPPHHACGRRRHRTGDRPRTCRGRRGHTVHPRAGGRGGPLAYPGGRPGGRPSRPARDRGAAAARRRGRARHRRARRAVPPHDQPAWIMGWGDFLGGTGRGGVAWHGIRPVPSHSARYRPRPDAAGQRGRPRRGRHADRR